MPVPSVITDLSTTAGSNSPAGTDSIGTNMDDYVRALSAFIAQVRDGSKNITLASAGAPSQAFTGDSNTGTFSPGADIWAVSTGGTERVRVDASGRFLNTSNTQPAFLATGSITLGAPVIYATEVFDRGSCYDNTTGVFTAPVAGVYNFSAGLGNTSLTSGVEFYASIAKNGSAVINFTIYKHGTTAAGGNGSLTISLAANDTIRVDCSSGPSTASTTWNYFCGHLLY
jgi:C1q domain